MHSKSKIYQNIGLFQDIMKYFVFSVNLLSVLEVYTFSLFIIYKYIVNTRAIYVYSYKKINYFSVYHGSDQNYTNFDKRVATYIANFLLYLPERIL